MRERVGEGRGWATQCGCAEGVGTVWVRERGAARAGARVHPAQPYSMCVYTRGTEQRSVEGDHVHVDLVRVGVQGLGEGEDEREEGREEDVPPHHGVDLTIACKRVVHAQVSTRAVRHGGSGTGAQSWAQAAAWYHCRCRRSTRCAACAPTGASAASTCTVRRRGRPGTR